MKTLKQQRPRLIGLSVAGQEGDCRGGLAATRERGLEQTPKWRCSQDLQILAS